MQIIIEIIVLLFIIVIIERIISIVEAQIFQLIPPRFQTQKLIFAEVLKWKALELIPTIPKFLKCEFLKLKLQLF